MQTFALSLVGFAFLTVQCHSRALQDDDRQYRSETSYQSSDKHNQGKAQEITKTPEEPVQQLNSSKSEENTSSKVKRFIPSNAISAEAILIPLLQRYVEEKQRIVPVPHNILAYQNAILAQENAIYERRKADKIKKQHRPSSGPALTISHHIQTIDKPLRVINHREYLPDLEIVYFTDIQYDQQGNEKDTPGAVLITHSLSAKPKTAHKQPIKDEEENAEVPAKPKTHSVTDIRYEYKYGTKKDPEQSDEEETEKDEPEQVPIAHPVPAKPKTSEEHQSEDEYDSKEDTPEQPPITHTLPEQPKVTHKHEYKYSEYESGKDKPESGDIHYEYEYDSEKESPKSEKISDKPKFTHKHQYKYKYGTGKDNPENGDVHYEYEYDSEKETPEYGNEQKKAEPKTHSVDEPKTVKEHQYEYEYSTKNESPDEGPINHSVQFEYEYDSEKETHPESKPITHSVPDSPKFSQKHQYKYSYGTGKEKPIEFEYSYGTEDDHPKKQQKSKSKGKEKTPSVDYEIVYSTDEAYEEESHEPENKKQSHSGEAEKSPPKEEHEEEEYDEEDDDNKEEINEKNLTSNDGVVYYTKKEFDKKLEKQKEKFINKQPASNEHEKLKEDHKENKGKKPKEQVYTSDVKFEKNVVYNPAQAKTVVQYHLQPSESNYKSDQKGAAYHHPPAQVQQVVYPGEGAVQKYPNNVGNYHSITGKTTKPRKIVQYVVLPHQQAPVAQNNRYTTTQHFQPAQAQSQQSESKQKLSDSSRLPESENKAPLVFFVDHRN